MHSWSTYPARLVLCLSAVDDATCDYKMGRAKKPIVGNIIAEITVERIALTCISREMSEYSYVRCFVLSIKSVNASANLLEGLIFTDRQTPIHNRHCLTTAVG